GWSLDQLAGVAAQLGSDVPFFLANGAAVCRGRGERVEAVAGLGTIWFVVVRPPEGLSTAAVYEACRPSESRQLIDTMVNETKRRNWRAVGPIAVNGLLPAARELSPAVGRVME